jgi:hypothetical protein
MGREAEKVPVVRKLRYGWSRGTVVALASLALFLAGDIVLMMMREDFAHSDNSIIEVSL